MATEHGFNGVDRGVYIADNLELLRSLNDECIDLVCIDPPFAKNDTFRADRLRPELSPEELENERRLLHSWGAGSAAQAAAAGLAWPYGRLQGGYRDIWSWEDDIHEEWLKSLEDDYDAIGKLIEITRYATRERIAAYLCYMAIRLLEIHRVLKPHGSLYLHCDKPVDAYLFQLLNIIFGDGEDGNPGYRSNIVWKRTSAHNDAKGYGRICDTILYYVKGNDYTWNRVFMPYDRQHIDTFYRNDDGDGRGRYTLADMASPNPRPNMMYPWRGHASPRMGWRYSRERMAELDREGRIWYPESTEQRPRLKRYLSEMPGRPVQQLWDDIPPLHSQARERTGYPTQKPVALAERIIAVSSNPGDIVLDCFAGCAYAAVAAERLERRWIACDFNPRAWTVFKRQFAKPHLVVLDCNDQTAGQQVLNGNPVVTVHGPGDLPVRTSPPRSPEPQTFVVPERTFKVPASIIPEAEMLEQLLELSGYMAWCCGYANRMPDGTVIRTTRNFHLDHLAPKSREGTSNEIQNRAPMCPYHNLSKGSRQIALSQYRQEIADAGEMMVNSVSDLINLDQALDAAMQIYGQAYAARHPSATGTPA